MTAPIIAISRLRIGTDGHGITTLVAFHGCPLRCRYCLNPQCLSSSHRATTMSVAEVMRAVVKDELYYFSTGGGVTFGGGEPLLRSEFIREMLELGAKRWRIVVETSLNVPRENVAQLLPYVDEFIVDIKDMNPDIYTAYTGKSNELVMSNLRYLVEQGRAGDILCRIPLIPQFNTREDQLRSRAELEAMGLTRFNMFKYRINIKK